MPEDLVLLADDVFTNYFPDAKSKNVLVDASLLLNNDRHSIATDVWQTPKEIFDKLVSNNLTFDCFASLHKKYGDDIHLLFDCSTRDGDLAKVQNYFDDGIMDVDEKQADEFQQILKEAIPEFKEAGVSLFIWDDLYIPSGLDKLENQYLILFIHGGSFNSGSKEDGESWCKYYATKWYITASVDYTLQNQGKDASIYLMNEEIENAVTAIKQKTEELGYHIAGMAPCGVSAGGTLAMNLAYNGNSAIPVKFVFQLAAPTYFAPSEWSLLMKVDRLDSEEKFCKMMTGKELEDYDTEIQNISPACIVNEDSVPSLIGYGLIDHCVPLSQKYYLIEVYDRDNVMYDYIEFPKSNHGMYNDLDKLQEFLDKSLEYARVYFTN